MTSKTMTFIELIKMVKTLGIRISPSGGVIHIEKDPAAFRIHDRLTGIGIACGK